MNYKVVYQENGRVVVYRVTNYDNDMVKYEEVHSMTPGCTVSIDVSTNETRIDYPWADIVFTQSDYRKLKEAEDERLPLPDCCGRSYDEV